MDAALCAPALKGAPGRRAPARAIASSSLPTAAAAPASVTLAMAQAEVRIFQIYYEPWHLPLLDPAFIPLDNQGTPDELLEFAVFERLAHSPHVEGARLWGALSWRFAEKTGMTGTHLAAEIARDPDRDVYFCNPFPQNEALYHNLWVQGETAHPHFLELVNKVLEAAGFTSGETMVLEPSSACSAANYFIGSPAFWNAYLPFVRRLLTPIDKILPSDVRDQLHSNGGDARGVHGGASYLPFIVERLFPLFMRTEGAALRAHKIALPAAEAAMDVHLSMLRDLKDAACSSRSPWLAACWTNYRSLYLKQQHGPAWCSKFLRAITPCGIHFA